MSDLTEAPVALDSRSNLVSFNSFTRLPTKLRLKILHEAALPTTSRIVELYLTEILPMITVPLSAKFKPRNFRLSASPRSQQPSELSRVSKEARSAVLDTHHLYFHWQKDALLPGYVQGSLHFDSDRDILYLNSETTADRTEPLDWLKLFISASPPAARKQIRALAMNCDYLGEDFPQELELLVNLELIILVMDHGRYQDNRPGELFLIPDLMVCNGRSRRQCEDLDTWLEAPHGRKVAVERRLWHGCAGKLADTEGSLKLKFSDASREEFWWREKKWHRYSLH